MRILHLIFSHINSPVSAGGSAIRTHEVYKRLADRHEITVLTAAWPEGPREEVIDGVRYLHLGSPRKGEGWSRAGFAWTMNWVAANARKRWGADLLVVDISPFTPCFAPWLTKVPVIGIVQSWIDLVDARRKHGAVGPLAVRIRDVAIKGYRYLIAVSPTIRAELEQRCDSGARIELVPYGIDGRLFNCNGEEQPYFLFLGRLEKFTKGLDLLVRGFEIYRQRYDGNYRLFIAGLGSFEAELREMVKKAGMEATVDFLGWVDGEDKIRVLSNCAAFCMSSRRESWGLSAMEAAACGKPVIGFDVPGVRDAVRNGETGILVPAEDVEAYAEAMARVSEDAELRSRLGMAGREWAKGFSWDETARKQEKFYLSVLESEGGRK